MMMMRMMMMVTRMMRMMMRMTLNETTAEGHSILVTAVSCVTSLLH